MKNFKKTLLASLTLVVLGVTGCQSTNLNASDSVNLLPQPINLNVQQGKFTFDKNTVIAVQDESQKLVADTFVSLFNHSANFTPKVVVGGEGNIKFTADPSMKDEAYVLDIKPEGINIKAKDSRGFFYALQSIRLMLPAAIDGQQKIDTDWSIAATTISDEPRFGYRGFMLDVARYFAPKEDIKQLIDCMAMLKLNRLHLHLTDDNGWRLEIKKYPKLTEVGAWRVDRPNQYFSERRNPQKGEPTPIGGFYTQEDMKEIIAYAQARQVDIIPEIDLPAHSNAALAAYPQYACPPTQKKFIGVLPGLGGRAAENIFCAGNEETYDFLEDVLTEVMDLFPSHYMHIGGDEAYKAEWKICPLCQKKIKQEHLKDEEALQGYFMSRIGDFVRSKGKEVMGWDEMTNSKIPEGAIVYGWQEYGDAALKAAAQGHRFVMTPAKITYLIRYQGPQWFEPLTYFGNNTLSDVFNYEPIQASWKPEYEKFLMGVQASMWNEFTILPKDIYHQVFPRLAALSYIAWEPKGEKDWPQFIKGLDNFLAHLDAKGVNYARTMYNIQHKITPTADGKLNVNLNCERPDVEIRYTLDGSEPTAESPVYTSDIILTDDKIVKSATFRNGVQEGQTLTLPVSWNKATGKKFVENVPGTEVLVNGLRGSSRESDFEYFTSATPDPVVLTLDLEKPEQIHEVIIGGLTNYGMAVHKPKGISVDVSLDNQNFTNIGKQDYTDEQVFTEGRFKEDFSFITKHVNARYIRITLKSAGANPESHVRPGQASKICLDEIIVK